jgi:hypothetical protein
MDLGATSGRRDLRRPGGGRHDHIVHTEVPSELWNHVFPDRNCHSCPDRRSCGVKALEERLGVQSRRHR